MKTIEGFPFELADNYNSYYVYVLCKCGAVGVRSRPGFCITNRPLEWHEPGTFRFSAPACAIVRAVRA